ncbi:hypothetical protein CTRI78_v007569 [Colletotrichum trifolii]|uniref:Uncharacterized protein n=1 Tax=Colletotrichum trifolii TaxID=5466 RepID=A0A4V3HVJ3_COLTR|nr:hypothetical protein CTRI78_v007569 [Colletotrichum trifolii]
MPRSCPNPSFRCHRHFPVPLRSSASSIASSLPAPLFRTPIRLSPDPDPKLAAPSRWSLLPPPISV